MGIIVLLCTGAHAASVLLISGSDSPSSSKAQVELAARIYGLEIENVVVGRGEPSFQELKRRDIVAVVISSDIIPRLDQTRFFGTLRQIKGRGIPLAVIGISSADRYTDAFLQRLSKGSIETCKAPVHDINRWQFSFSEDRDVTQQLAGAKIPFQGTVNCGLSITEGSRAKALIVASSQGESLDVFAESSVDGRRLFFLQALSQDAATTGEFSSLLPMMMVLRFAAGDQVCASSWPVCQFYCG